MSSHDLSLLNVKLNSFNFYSLKWGGSRKKQIALKKSVVNFSFERYYLSGPFFTKLVITDKWHFLLKASEVLASDWLSADLSLIILHLSLKKGFVKWVPGNLLHFNRIFFQRLLSVLNEGSIITIRLKMLFTCTCNSMPIMYCSQMVSIVDLNWYSFNSHKGIRELKGFLFMYNNGCAFVFLDYLCWPHL